MKVTFLHKGRPERPGEDFGETYQVGEFTAWLDVAGAVYVDVDGVQVESDSIGAKVRIFNAGDETTDIPWSEIGDHLRWGLQGPAPLALTAMLVHAHLISYHS